MKIYFEDDSLVLGRYAPDFNFVIDAGGGMTHNEDALKLYLKITPDCVVYTNSLVAMDNRYCWNKELSVPELYIRRDRFSEWFRVDELTDKEIRQQHNLFSMYRNGAFRFPT